MKVLKINILIKYIDRKGSVREKVFYNLLDCMDIKLSDETIQKINKHFISKEKPIVVYYDKVIRNL